jgi:hypothetical protein
MRPEMDEGVLEVMDLLVATSTAEAVLGTLGVPGALALALVGGYRIWRKHAQKER